MPRLPIPVIPVQPRTPAIHVPPPRTLVTRAILVRPRTPVTRAILVPPRTPVTRATLVLPRTPVILVLPVEVRGGWL